MLPNNPKVEPFNVIQKAYKGGGSNAKLPFTELKVRLEFKWGSFSGF
jgi:hypothetical protein